MFDFTQDDLLSEDVMILDGQKCHTCMGGHHANNNDKIHDKIHFEQGYCSSTILSFTSEGGSKLEGC